MGQQISDVLRDLAAGQTYDEINARLSEVVEGVMATRKVGEISVKLKIKPNGENSIIVTDEIKTKVPEPTRGETVFFADSYGGLRRTDPRQGDLESHLREVKAPADTEPTKEVS